MTNNKELELAIGKIHINLLSLEFVLRLFLYEIEKSKNSIFNLDNLIPGTLIEENPITNFDSLGDLIKKVNQQLVKLGIDENVDTTLVKLRDDLVHGRITSLTPIGHYTLLKFSPPKQGMVQVTTNIDLTPQWLAEQIERTNAEIQKIVEISRTLGQSCFPG